MSISTISVICYYNGQILRTETDVKYGGGSCYCAFGCTG